MTDADLEICARAALSRDFDPVHWDDAPEWRRIAARAVAKAALDTNNPDFTRMAWFECMCQQGWRWDKTFDEQKKTHPGIVAGELTPGGSRHWLAVVSHVRDIGRSFNIRMLGP